MSRQLKNPGKTTFVRNTDQKIPKVTVKSSQIISKPQPSTSKVSSNQIKKIPQKSTVRFDVPKPNSSKNIVKEIRAVRNIKQEIKDEKTEVIEQKITKRMNFPIDKAIYKDLVPLCTKRLESTHVSSPRDPLPPKDVEPKLSDYYKPTEGCQYVFKVEPQKIKLKKVENIKFDGCSLSRHLKLWNQEPELVKFK